VVNGARQQERAEALSTVHATEAVMNNSNAEMERRRELFDAGVISREEYERYARQYEVARAKRTRR
jgi:multidrug resistance efflux pump